MTRQVIYFPCPFLLAGIVLLLSPPPILHSTVRTSSSQWYHCVSAIPPPQSVIAPTSYNRRRRLVVNIDDDDAGDADVHGNDRDILRNIPPGGKTGINNLPVVVAKRSLLEIPPPPPLPTNIVVVDQSVSSRIQNVRDTTKKLRRTEFFALLGLRIAFLFLLPLSIVAFVLTLFITIVITIPRVLTFGFLLGDVSKVMFAVSRAFLTLLVASLSGIILPVFGVFGLIAGLSVAAVGVAEPLLRMRYRSQLRKLRHLHRLVTDPVLMETASSVLRGAKAITMATSTATVASQAAIGKRARTTVKGAKAKIDSTDAASREIVRVLLESGTLSTFTDSMESKLPEPVVSWGRDQWGSIRRSGMLEKAASGAMSALRGELEGAERFLPYLEALEVVRKSQDKKK